MKGKETGKPKGRIELGDLRLPAVSVPRRTPIDPAKFIPVVGSRDRGKGPVRVVRRADLLPKSVPAAAVGAFNNFGDVLVDVFSPTYGAYYPRGGRNAFIFSMARTFSLITHNMWRMELEWNKPATQRFSFNMVTGAQGNYVKVQLGMTQGRGVANGAIIGCYIDSSKFNLDLSHRSFLFFDLILAGPSPHFFEFSLGSDANPRATSLLEIQQVELYQTIRTFPEPPLADA